MVGGVEEVCARGSEGRRYFCRASRSRNEVVEDAGEGGLVGGEEGDGEGGDVGEGGKGEGRSLDEAG